MLKCESLVSIRMLGIIETYEAFGRSHLLFAASTGYVFQILKLGGTSIAMPPMHWLPVQRTDSLSLTFRVFFFKV